MFLDIFAPSWKCSYYKAVSSGSPRDFDPHDDTFILPRPQFEFLRSAIQRFEPSSQIGQTDARSILRN